MTSPKKAYAEAGVDIARADSLLGSVKKDIRAASRPEVLGAVGGFGGLFDLSASGYKKPVLVASTDGVGTKLKVAGMAGKHDGVGVDIVNHCLNDIAVLGAEPLFFLDYIGAGKLDGAVYQAVLRGVAKACKAAGCALLGGETAEMPGVYAPGDYDIVGTIVGVAEKSRIYGGEGIRPGDVLLGLASNGLHTNGYSLARKIVFENHKLTPTDVLPGTKTQVGTALLKPHTNYATALLDLFGAFNNGRRAGQRKDNGIFGAAHITGGGFTGNIPRILPDDCGAVVDTHSWKRPPVFQFLESESGVDRAELFEVFNMGVGMVLVVDPAQADAIAERAKSHKHKVFRIGEVTAREKIVELVL